MGHGGGWGRARALECGGRVGQGWGARALGRDRERLRCAREAEGTAGPPRLSRLEGGAGKVGRERSVGWPGQAARPSWAEGEGVGSLSFSFHFLYLLFFPIFFTMSN